MKHPCFHGGESKLIDLQFTLTKWAEESGSGSFKHVDFHTVLEIFQKPE